VIDEVCESSDPEVTARDAHDQAARHRALDAAPVLVRMRVQEPAVLALPVGPLTHEIHDARGREGPPDLRQGSTHSRVQILSRADRDAEEALPAGEQVVAGLEGADDEVAMLDLPRLGLRQQTRHALGVDPPGSKLSELGARTFDRCSILLHAGADQQPDLLAGVRESRPEGLDLPFECFECLRYASVRRHSDRAPR
jgi:hypothetical protein